MFTTKSAPYKTYLIKIFYIMSYNTTFISLIFQVVSNVISLFLRKLDIQPVILITRLHRLF